MAAVGVEARRPETAMEETCNAKGAVAKQGEGLKQYYLQHIHELQRLLRQKTNNLNRLEAQRNELNSRGPLSSSSLIPNFWMAFDFVFLGIGWVAIGIFFCVGSFLEFLVEISFLYDDSL